MRLSGLVALLLLLIFTLLTPGSTAGASSASAGVGAASSGPSHSASSSGASHTSSSVGAASSHASSAPSASGRSGSAHGTSASSASKPSPAKSDLRTRVSGPPVTTKPDREPEKRGFFSFLRHRKPTPVPETPTILPVSCKRGQNCLHPCAQGKTWNGFGCGLPYQYAQYQPYWRFNNCSALAEELRALRAKMLTQPDPGDSLRYRSLLSQYEACLQQSRIGSFGFYAFDPNLFAAPLFDMP